MPAPMILIDRATLVATMMYAPPTLEAACKEAIKSADREYDQAKAHMASLAAGDQK